MIPARLHERLTVDAYLASEDGAEFRHEYIGGEVYAIWLECLGAELGLADVYEEVE